MPTNLLCFKEVREARLSGEITLEECLRHVVVHYKDSQSTAKSVENRQWLPASFEREVRDLVLSQSYQTLTDDGECDANAPLFIPGRTAYMTLQMQPSSI